jgi:hypothetical protein
MINWNRADFVARAARAVYASRPADAEFLVWDNGSRIPELPPIYESLEADGIEVFRHDKNDGLDPTQNLILERFFADPECDMVFMLEDGCLVMPWTIAEMRKVLQEGKLPPREEFEREPIGIVGCSLTSGPECQVFAYLPQDWLDPMLNEPDDGSPWNGAALASWTQHPTELWRTIEAPDPFLWGLTRKTWETVGKIDEAFWMGWGTNNDYCYRARLAGIHAATAWNGFAITWDRHVPRPWAEKNPEYRNSWMGRGIRRMAQKHGGPEAVADVGWLLCQSNYREYTKECD